MTRPSDTLAEGTGDFPPAALWLLLIALLLISCTSGETTEVAPTPIPGATPTPISLPPDATTSARIRARSYLLVGVRYDLEPFGYVTEEGALAGFDVDLARELARRWLSDAAAVRFRQVRSDTAIGHLQAGDVDLVAAALTHDKWWEREVDFGPTYYLDGQALLVRVGGGIAAPDDLAERRVGVVTGSGAVEALRAATSVSMTVTAYPDFDAAVTALSQGEVDAVADLRRRLARGARTVPGTEIVGRYTEVPLALAFGPDDPFFRDLVNLTLQQLAADGTYAELYTRWFGADPPYPVELWPGETRLSLSDAPLTRRSLDTVAAIQTRGRLVVAMVPDRSPFSCLDETGTPAGYEVDLVRLMADRWLGDQTAVDFVPTTEEGGTAMLTNGETDLLLGGLPHTWEREQALDFGPTTYVAGEGLMVVAGGGITDVVSLAGEQVAAVEGTRSADVLLAAAQARGLSVTVLPMPNLEAAMAALSEGWVVAVVGDRSTMLGPAYTTPGLGVLPLRLTRVPLALALPPGDSAFRDLVTFTLQAMKAEGLFDAVYADWFDDHPPPIEDWPGAPYMDLQLIAPEGG